MALSKTRRAELEAELLQVMDKLDALKVELREQLQDHRVQVKLYAEKLKSLRDILSGREGEQSVIAGCESGTVKPPAPRPAKPAAKKLLYGYGPDQCGNIGLDGTRCQLAVGHDGAHEAEGSGGHRITWRSGPARPAKKVEKSFVYPAPRPKGEIVRWRADQAAKRPPLFVIEMTGLKTKKALVAKYGFGVTFEKAKPLPTPAAPPPFKGASPKDGVNTCRGCGKTRHRPGGALTTGGYCFSCHTKRSAAVAPAKPKPDHLARHMAKREAEEKAVPESLAWTEGDGTQQVVVGSMTYRAQEITPTRWVLESKSERERAWHKEEGCLPSLAACEAWVTKRRPGTTFAELCLDCGVAADKPSPDCTECDHAKEAARG